MQCSMGNPALILLHWFYRGCSMRQGTVAHAWAASLLIPRLGFNVGERKEMVSKLAMCQTNCKRFALPASASPRLAGFV